MGVDDVRDVEESLLLMGVGRGGGLELVVVVSGEVGEWDAEMEASRSLERSRANEGMLCGEVRSPVTSTWAPMKYRICPRESKSGATIRRLRKGDPSRRLEGGEMVC